MKFRALWVDYRNDAIVRLLAEREMEDEIPMVTIRASEPFLDDESDSDSSEDAATIGGTPQEEDETMSFTNDSPMDEQLWKETSNSSNDLSSEREYVPECCVDIVPINNSSVNQPADPSEEQKQSFLSSNHQDDLKLELLEPLQPEIQEYPAFMREACSTSPSFFQSWTKNHSRKLIANEPWHENIRSLLFRRHFPVPSLSAWLQLELDFFKKIRFLCSARSWRPNFMEHRSTTTDDQDCTHANKLNEKEPSFKKIQKRESFSCETLSQDKTHGKESSMTNSRAIVPYVPVKKMSPPDHGNETDHGKMLGFVNMIAQHIGKQGLMQTPISGRHAEKVEDQHDPSDECLDAATMLGCPTLAVPHKPLQSRKEFDLFTQIPSSRKERTGEGAIGDRKDTGIARFKKKPRNMNGANTDKVSERTDKFSSNDGLKALLMTEEMAEGGEATNDEQKDGMTNSDEAHVPKNVNARKREVSFVEPSSSPAAKIEKQTRKRKRKEERKERRQKRRERKERKRLDRSSRKEPFHEETHGEEDTREIRQGKLDREKAPEIQSHDHECTSKSIGLVQSDESHKKSHTMPKVLPERGIDEKGSTMPFLMGLVSASLKSSQLRKSFSFQNKDTSRAELSSQNVPKSNQKQERQVVSTNAVQGEVLDSERDKQPPCTSNETNKESPSRLPLGHIQVPKSEEPSSAKITTVIKPSGDKRPCPDSKVQTKPMPTSSTKPQSLSSIRPREPMASKLKSYSSKDAGNFLSHTVSRTGQQLLPGVRAVNKMNKFPFRERPSNSLVVPTKTIESFQNPLPVAGPKNARGELRTAPDVESNKMNQTLPTLTARSEGTFEGLLTEPPRDIVGMTVSTSTTNNIPLFEDIHDDPTAIPPITILCAEDFLERWGPIVAALSSGKWSTTENPTSVLMSQTSLPYTSAKILVEDSPLVDQCNVDLELPGRSAILIISTSILVDEYCTKSIVLRTVALSGINRYKHLHIMLVLDSKVSPSIAQRIFKLQSSILSTRRSGSTQLYFKTTGADSLAGSIAEVVTAYRNDLGGTKHLFQDLHDKQAVERTMFLLHLIPTLCAYGALDICHLIRAYSAQRSTKGTLHLLFTDHHLRQHIMLVATSTESGNIHPQAMTQLAEFLVAPLANSTWGEP